MKRVLLVATCSLLLLYIQSCKTSGNDATNTFSNPLIFVTSDPDDDFSILETTIDHNQWFAFRPSLPVERLSNINYGQSNDWDSSTKILALKGVGNGFSNLLYFRKETGKWILYKFEDTSI